MNENIALYTEIVSDIKLLKLYAQREEKLTPSQKEEVKKLNRAQKDVRKAEFEKENKYKKRIKLLWCLAEIERKIRDARLPADIENSLLQMTLRIRETNIYFGYDTEKKLQELDVRFKDNVQNKRLLEQKNNLTAVVNANNTSFVGVPGSSVAEIMGMDEYKKRHPEFYHVQWNEAEFIERSKNYLDKIKDIPEEKRNNAQKNIAISLYKRSPEGKQAIQEEANRDILIGMLRAKNRVDTAEIRSLKKKQSALKRTEKTPEQQAELALLGKQIQILNGRIKKIGLFINQTDSVMKKNNLSMTELMAQSNKNTDILAQRVLDLDYQGISFKAKPKNNQIVSDKKSGNIKNTLMNASSQSGKSSVYIETVSDVDNVKVNEICLNSKIKRISWRRPVVRRTTALRKPVKSRI